ncbi:MAG: pantoate--beta-alanine ligase [Treponema sp.]
MEENKMYIVKTVHEAKDFVRKCKLGGKSIGLVPTMGFLHDGHASLIKRARQENDIVIVSDFVNPAQFGANEDFGTYPRDFETDLQLCERLGVDLFFYPETSQMYDNHHTFIAPEVLADGLCGASRPSFFRGVCTVVAKLFNISKADRAYFGQKDAQQLLIIKKMVKDLNFDVEIVACPIIREADGLAMSSRNTYLNSEERKAALCLSVAIREGKAMIQQNMDSQEIIDCMKKIIDREPLAKIDYISIVDLEELKPAAKIDRPVLAAMAVFIGKTRLIDNFIYEFEENV